MTNYVIEQKKAQDKCMARLIAYLQLKTVYLTTRLVATSIINLRVASLRKFLLNLQNTSHMMIVLSAYFPAPAKGSCNKITVFF